MPLPSPRSGESQSDFISRCMGSETMKNEYPGQEQRSAVCYSQWGGQSNNVECHREAYIVANYQLRTESYMGRKHLIAPVVLMVEGVHSGSKGPTLYTAQELMKFPEAWNGRPVPVFHPQGDYGYVSCNDPNIIQQQSVGHLFNVHFDSQERKLRGEIWIDEQQAQRVSPITLSYIREGRQLEVSTGVFTEDDLVTGNWHGEEYHAVARNLRPDHLALLPGEQGACSWQDGCGVRANEEGGDQLSGKLYRRVPPANNSTEEKVHPLQVNEVAEGYRSLLQQIQSKLDGMDTDTRMHFLEEMYDDFIVYRVDGQGGQKLYKREYSVNDNGSVEFGNEPKEVRQKVEYVEITDNSANSKENEGGETMQKDKMIQALIEHKETKYDEADREWLNGLSECQLGKMMPEEQAAPADPPTPKEEPAANQQPSKEEALQVLKESLKDKDQFLTLLPDELREQFEDGLALHQQSKQEIVKTITANSDAFTEQELQGKKIDELRKLAKLVQPKTNWSPANVGGQVPSVHGDEPEPMPLAGVQFKE